MNCTEFFQQVGANMREIRRTKKMTQSQIAHKLHMATISYGVIERGKIGTSLKTLFNIAQILEISPTRLLSNKDEIFLSKMDLACLYNQEAKGEYIFPLDGDDKISPTVLEKAVAILDRNSKVGIVGGKTEFFGIKQGEWKLPPYQFPDILRGNCLVCSCMFRKSDWEKVGGYNPNMKYGWEDYDLWVRALMAGLKLANVQEILLKYRWHPANLSHTKIKEHTASTNDIKKEVGCLYDGRC